MSQPIAINTLVLIVRTGTGLDGATGVVEAGEDWHIGYALGGAEPRKCFGYQVLLGRCTPWGDRFCATREHLVPIAGPGTPVDTEITNDLPAHALV